MEPEGVQDVGPGAGGLPPLNLTGGEARAGAHGGPTEGLATSGDFVFKGALSKPQPQSLMQALVAQLPLIAIVGAVLWATSKR